MGPSSLLSVSGGFLRMIDDEHVHWLSGRFQLQTELLLWAKAVSIALMVTIPPMDRRIVLRKIRTGFMIPDYRTRRSTRIERSSSTLYDSWFAVRIWGAPPQKSCVQSLLSILPEDRRVLPRHSVEVTAVTLAGKATDIMG
jgi:hypothetical protein